MTQHRMPEPKLRDEFRRELRMRLMSEAQLVLRPKTRTSTWVGWLRPAMAVGLAAVVLFAGAGVAAAGSLPGDPAFGLKRAFEDARVALTGDDVDRVKLLAQITDTRLAELQQVANRSDKAPTASEEYAKAVARFRAAVDALRQAAPADKRAAADEVADAAQAKHEAVLEQLKGQVPDKAKESLERAIEDERNGKIERDNDKRTNEDPSSPRPTRTLEPGRAPTPRATPTPRASR